MITVKKITFLLYSLLLAFPGILFSQDAYHSNLQSELQANYGLPEGDWVFNDTEAANLNMDYSYGSVSVTDAMATGQDFSQKVQLEVSQVAGQPWSTGYGLNSSSIANAGDRCILVIWMRSIGTPGKITMALQHASTFAGEFYLTAPVAETWGRFIIPFELTDSYDAGELQMAFQLNWQDQLLEFGGMAILNYGTDVALSDLPSDLNNQFYDGHAADAPWRDEAAQRIEQIRKADLDIEVVDENGMPVEGAQVEVLMQEHAFGFGSAVAAQLVNGNSQQNDTYQDRLLDLDGEGNRFNCVVFENATKWQAWEDNWFGVSKEDKANTVEWLVNEGFKVRGHTLIWPKYSDMPSDIEANAGDPDYVRNRVLEHIEDILEYPGLEGNFSDWDVLNEISVLDTLANIMQGAPGYPTGREIYAEIFNKYKEIDPDGEAYLNDFTVFGGGESPVAAAKLETYIQELQDADAEIDGIGFQGHIGTYPTGIPRVYDILEHYYTAYGTKAKITEFDFIGMTDDELEAKYLADFYTIVFSHESADAILMWGFWDGAHWYDNAPLFNQDWSLKPSGQAFLDLVFDEWWTEESGQTDANGQFGLRGFKGKYQLKIDCGDISGTEWVDLNENTSITIDCSTLSAMTEIDLPELSISPNPVEDFLQLTWESNEPANLRLYDLTGNLVLSQDKLTGPVDLKLDLPAGMYLVELQINGQRVVQRVVKQ